MQIRSGSSFIATLLALTFSFRDAGASPLNWPQFRGPNSSGVALKGRPPIKIGPTNNVRWCIDVPWSPSSPCVWGDRIFLTTFEGGELQTHCYAARTGDLFWSRGIKPRKLEVFHSTDGSPAASTPVTDGKRVVSYFGSILPWIRTIQPGRNEFPFWLVVYVFAAASFDIDLWRTRRTKDIFRTNLCTRF